MMRLLHGLLLGKINAVSASPLPVAIQAALDFENVEAEEDFIAWLDRGDR